MPTTLKQFCDKSFTTLAREDILTWKQRKLVDETLIDVASTKIRDLRAKVVRLVKADPEHKVFDPEAVIKVARAEVPNGSIGEWLFIGDLAPEHCYTWSSLGFITLAEAMTKGEAKWTEFPEFKLPTAAEIEAAKAKPADPAPEAEAPAAEEVAKPKAKKAKAKAKKVEVEAPAA